MSVKHFDLSVEALIREGLEDLKDNVDEQITDIFGEFLASYLSTKYGQAEIDKIKTFILEEPIKVVFHWSDVDTSLPCISINVMNDTENLAYTALDDFEDEIDEDTDPAIIVASFTADSYDSATGRVDCTIAGTDLSAVRVNNIYQDGSSNEFKILGPIYNETGNRSFYIAKGATVNLTGGQIQSAVDFQRNILRFSPYQEQLLVGIHSENSWLTRWLYHIVKYIILTRKMDLDARGIKSVTYSGSDFNQALGLLPDRVRSRFLTLSSPYVHHTWNAEQVSLIDSVAQNATNKIRVERKSYEPEREDEETLTVGSIEES